MTDEELLTQIRNGLFDVSGLNPSNTIITEAERNFRRVEIRQWFQELRERYSNIVSLINNEGQLSNVENLFILENSVWTDNFLSISFELRNEDERRRLQESGLLFDLSINDHRAYDLVVLTGENDGQFRSTDFLPVNP